MHNVSFDYQMSIFDDTSAPPLILQGRQIAITGKLAFPREYAIRSIDSAGGKYSTCVSRNTDYLVVGFLKAGTSRKLQSARKQEEHGNKVRILSPFEFYVSIGAVS